MNSNRETVFCEVCALPFLKTDSAGKLFCPAPNSLSLSLLSLSKKLILTYRHEILTQNIFITSQFCVLNFGPKQVVYFIFMYSFAIF
jgi:hypothetical protein